MSPWPIVVGVPVVAGLGYAAWKYLFKRDEYIAPPPTPLPDEGETEKKKSQGTPSEVNGIPVCERTGKPYDADLFPDPVQTAAYMIGLGYIPAPDLVSGISKSEIKLFQKRAIKLKLPGAGSTHGEMSPCTLVSLKAAMELNTAGKWDLSKARG